MSNRYETSTVRVTLRVSEPVSAIVTHAEDALPILRAVFAELDADQEHFVLLALDSGHRLTGIKTLFSGGTSVTVVDRKIVFRTALLMGASAMILAHNHPSGRLEPSREDYCITQRLVRAANILDVKLLDHLILTDQGWCRVEFDRSEMD